LPFLRARLCIVIETIQIIKEVLEEKPFSVKEIFEDNWSSYLLTNKVRDIEQKEVEKMLSCKDESRGFWTCYCSKCNEYHNVYSGCNSRLCSHCGKRYADKWAEKLVENTFNVPHKHIVYIHL